MEIRKDLLQKYMHVIAIEQLIEEYTTAGYTVSIDEKIGKYTADLIARKGDDQIVVEVKTGKLTSKRKAAIARIADYVRSRPGFKFLVVVATPPKEKVIEVKNLETIISRYMFNHLPSELDALSTHTSIDEVEDISISEIIVDDDEMFVKGTGVVSIELQFGSDGDQDRGDGLKGRDNFPFTFEATLRLEDQMTAKEIDIVVDTDSYYV